MTAVLSDWREISFSSLHEEGISQLPIAAELMTECKGTVTAIVDVKGVYCFSFENSW